MTAQYFNTQDEIDQLNLVFTYGADVAQRNTEEHQITLFQLFSFYVEIFSSGDKMLCAVNGFDDVDRLDIYIENINITSLF
ncbi:MAG: hypothetical protein IPI88_15815 [Chitinophagaceae bacterium]|nr:hypothetical protein [Chitinophagaceae bacterium]